MASTSKIVIQVDADTVKAIKNVKGFEKAATSGFKKTSKSLLNVKNALIGLGAVKIGQTVVSGLTAATKAASDFSLAVAEIETILPKGQKSTQELKEELRALQRQFGGKATKQAKAYYQTISAGITDAAKAAKVLEVANKLAIGGIGELEPTIDVLTSIINTYGDENLSAAEASDLLFTTVKNGKTTLSELSQFIGKALPNSKRLGVSFSELTASIATLTSRGLDTAKASTQLTRFFGAIANGQDRAAKLGPKVAEAFDIQALKAKGLTKFLQDLKVAINGDEAALQELLGSNEAASAFTVLTAQNFEKLTASLKDNEKAAGATETAYQRIFKEFSTQASIFGGLIEQLTEGFGEELIAGFADEFIELNKAIKTNLPAIQKELKNLAPTIVAFTKLLSSLTLGFTSFATTTLAETRKEFDTLFLWYTQATGTIGELKGQLDKNLAGIGLSDQEKEIAASTKKLENIFSGTKLKLVKDYRELVREQDILIGKNKELEESLKTQISEEDTQIAKLSSAYEDFQKAIDGEKIEVSIEAKNAVKSAKKAVKSMRQVAEKNPIPLEVSGEKFNFKDVFKEASKDARLGFENDIDKLLSDLSKLKPKEGDGFLDNVLGIKGLESAKKNADDLVKSIKNAKGPGGKPLFSPDEASKFAKIIKDGTTEAADSLKEASESMQQAFATTGQILSGIASGAKATQDPEKVRADSLSGTEKEIAKLRKQITADLSPDETQNILDDIAKLEIEKFDKADQAVADAIAENQKVAKESAGAAVSAVGAGIADFVLPGLGQVVGPLLDVMQQSPEQLRLFLDEFINSFILIVEGIAENADVIILALVDALITKGGIVRIAAALIKAMVSLAGQFAMAVVAGITNGLGQFMDAFLNKFLVGVGEFLRSFVSALVSLPGQILSSIASAFEPILNFFRSWNPFSDEGGGNALYGRDSVAAKGQRFIEDLLFNQGGVVTANTGMIVPGTGSQDSVRALLTPGELVVPVPAVNNFRGFVGEEVDRRIAGANNQSSDGQPVLVQVIMNEEVLAEQMARINQDNQRVA